MPGRESLHHRVTRCLMRFLNAFCQIDMQEYARIREFELRKRARQTGGDPAQVDGKTRVKPLLWPKLVMWLCVYINIRLLIVIYWQCIYDYDHLKLKQIDAKLASLNSSTAIGRFGPQELADAFGQLDRFVALRQGHQKRYTESRAMLMRVGQPTKDVHWISSGFGAVLIWLTFFTYPLPVILTRLKLTKPPDMYSIRIMLSEDYELMKSQQLVATCVARLRDSSRNFVLNVLLRSKNLIDCAASPNTSGFRRTEPNTTGKPCECAPSLRDVCRSSSLAVQMRNHLFVCEFLDELQRTNQLLPINRSPEWVEQMSLHFALLAVSNFIYSFIFDVASLYWLPARFGYFHLEGPMDLLSYVELWILAAISVIAITLYICILQVNTRDQTKYMVWIIERIGQCTLDNDKLFALGMRRSPEATVRAINMNLARSVLDYEVFVAQFMPVQRTFSLTAKMTAIISLSTALIVRTFMPYADTDGRFLGIYFCIVVMAFNDSLLVPLYVVHNKSKRLYGRMMSLLCQAIELNSIIGVHQFPRTSPTSRLVCDQHLIWRLRLILIDTAMFTNRFATYALPKVPMTAPNIIKLHYWYVLLILSYYARIDAWKTALGDRQDDPLGLLGGL